MIRKNLTIDVVYENFKSSWFPVARSEDLDKPKSVTLFGINLVVFKDAGGTARVTDRRCIHRGADLSMGQVTGEGIECPYHGWVFNGENGKCVSVPSLQKDEIIPKTALIKSYPVIERYKHIWTCLDEPILDFPTFPEIDNLQFEWLAGEPIFTNSGFMLAIENFRDMAHFPFVHKSTMGDVSKIFPSLDVEQSGREIKASLFYPSKKDSEFSGMGDAWMHYHSYAPGLASIFYDYMDKGKRFLINFTSPISQESCIVFWAVAISKDFKGGTLQEIFKIESNVFAEDTPILNKIEPKEIYLDGSVKEVSSPADVYTLAYRRACINAVTFISDFKNQNNKG
jgi:phenylpropionate dioxygenase-like ring-hydroxylating dioxygenase large terminal subunit